MKLNAREMGEFFVLEVEGEVDAEHAPQLKRALVPAKEGSFKGIVLDFGKVSFIDSTGLGVLISLMRNLREHNRQLRVVRLNIEVRSIFEITRLYRIFDLADSVEQAIQDMRAKL